MLILTTALALATSLLPDDAVTLNVDPAAHLEMHAAWGPLLDSRYAFASRDARVGEPVVAQERAVHTAEAFTPFLPDGPVALGDVWPVDPAAALPFLRQLHTGATETMHHADPQSGVTAPGGWACLRAVSEQRVEIALRVHADFRLDPPGVEPAAHLTPSQFAGRLVIDRQVGAIIGFELAVPHGSSNVDVNLVHEEYGVIADIGRIDELSVRGGEFPADESYTSVQPPAQARLALKRRFYELAQVDWFELAEAHTKSRAEQRPMHVLILFGPLLDESC